jgi:TRAP-type C4-dicarboxylate transport system permease small subunit
MPELTSTRQLRLRVLSSTLIIVLAGMLLLNNQFLKGKTPWFGLIYWLIFLLLLLFLLGVTLMDVIELRRLLRNRNDQALQRILKEPPQNGTNKSDR